MVRLCLGLAGLRVRIRVKVWIRSCLGLAFMFF